MNNLFMGIVRHLARKRAEELAQKLGEKARQLFPGSAVNARIDSVNIRRRGLNKQRLKSSFLQWPSTWLKDGDL